MNPPEAASLVTRLHLSQICCSQGCQELLQLLLLLLLQHLLLLFLILLLLLLLLLFNSGRVGGAVIGWSGICGCLPAATVRIMGDCFPDVSRCVWSLGGSALGPAASGLTERRRKLVHPFFPVSAISSLSSAHSSSSAHFSSNRPG